MPPEPAVSHVDRTPRPVDGRVPALTSTDTSAPDWWATSSALREQGWSLRAIAAAVGQSHATIARYLATMPAPGGPGLGIFADPELFAPALCVDRSHLFDGPAHGESTAAVEHRHHHALALCRRCPVLDACRDLAATQTHGISGVWAGQIRGRRQAAADPDP